MALTLVIAVKQETEGAVAQLQGEEGDEKQAHLQAHVIVAEIGGIVYKIGVQRHHHERDELGADVADGIDSYVFQEFGSPIGGYVSLVACFFHSVLTRQRYKIFGFLSSLSTNVCNFATHLADRADN